MKVPYTTARAQLARLLDIAATGQTIVITRRKKPDVQLGPVEKGGSLGEDGETQAQAKEAGLSEETDGRGEAQRPEGDQGRTEESGGVTPSP